MSWQAHCAVPAVGHFKHQGMQLLVVGQMVDDVLVKLLVAIHIVQFTQHQKSSRQQRR